MAASGTEVTVARDGRRIWRTPRRSRRAAGDEDVPGAGQAPGIPGSSDADGGSFDRLRREDQLKFLHDVQEAVVEDLRKKPNWRWRRRRS